jgi:MFS family permease
MYFSFKMFYLYTIKDSIIKGCLSLKQAHNDLKATLKALYESLMILPFGSIISGLDIWCAWHRKGRLGAVLQMSELKVGIAVAERRAPQFSLGQTFASLKYPNYRLWFVGQLASLIGTWMQTTAQGYLVFELTHSPAFLGYVGFASGLPAWLFTLYGGVVSDRISRRTLQVITQTAMMLLAFILAALTCLGLVQPWHIVILAFALGVANAFDVPARQAFVVEMVEREDLSNAIALNSTMFNSATVVGPAVAGLMYALLGPAWCFTINGLSFLAVIAALLLMKLKPLVSQPQRNSLGADLKMGLRYVVSEPIVRTIIGIVAITSLFGLGFITLLPAWSVTVLGGDSATNGFLLSARGAGSLLGALMIASLGRFKFKGRLLSVGTFVFPLFLLIFAWVRWLPLSLLVLMGVGWGVMLLLNLANAMVQNLTPDELRGRVMSIYALSFLGMMPVGSLLAGSLAELVSEPAALVCGALVSLVVAVCLWLRVPQLRALE